MKAKTQVLNHLESVDNNLISAKTVVERGASVDTFIRLIETARANVAAAIEAVEREADDFGPNVRGR